MPCDTVTTVGVQLDKCNADLMMKALGVLALGPVLIGDVIHFGNREYINVKTGQAQLGWNRKAAEIKVEYSRQVIQQTAAKRGWTLKVDAKNQNKIQAYRR